jgi:hypothetical protein
MEKYKNAGRADGEDLMKRDAKTPQNLARE